MPATTIEEAATQQTFARFALRTPGFKRSPKQLRLLAAWLRTLSSQFADMSEARLRVIARAMTLEAISPGEKLDDIVGTLHIVLSGSMIVVDGLQAERLSSGSMLGDLTWWNTLHVALQKAPRHLSRRMSEAFAVADEHIQRTEADLQSVSSKEEATKQMQRALATHRAMMALSQGKDLTELAPELRHLADIVQAAQRKRRFSVIGQGGGFAAAWPSDGIAMTVDDGVELAKLTMEDFKKAAQDEHKQFAHETAHFLRERVRVFQQWSAPRALALSECFERQSVRRGTCIVDRGDAAEALMILGQGKACSVRVLPMNVQGRAVSIVVKLRDLLVGSVFAEDSLRCLSEGGATENFSSPAPQSRSYVYAIDDCEVLYLRRKYFPMLRHTGTLHVLETAAAEIPSAREIRDLVVRTAGLNRRLFSMLQDSVGSKYFSRVMQGCSVGQSYDSIPSDSGRASGSATIQPQLQSYPVVQHHDLRATTVPAAATRAFTVEMLGEGLAAAARTASNDVPAEVAHRERLRLPVLGGGCMLPPKLGAGVEWLDYNPTARGRAHHCPSSAPPSPNAIQPSHGASGIESDSWLDNSLTVSTEEAAVASTHEPGLDFLNQLQDQTRIRQLRKEKVETARSPTHGEVVPKAEASLRLLRRGGTTALPTLPLASRTKPSRKSVACPPALSHQSLYLVADEHMTGSVDLLRVFEVAATSCLPLSSTAVRTLRQCLADRATLNALVDTRAHHQPSASPPKLRYNHRRVARGLTGAPHLPPVAAHIDSTDECKSDCAEPSVGNVGTVSASEHSCAAAETGGSSKKRFHAQVDLDKQASPRNACLSVYRKAQTRAGIFVGKVHSLREHQLLEWRQRSMRAEAAEIERAVTLVIDRIQAMARITGRQRDAATSVNHILSGSGSGRSSGRLSGSQVLSSTPSVWHLARAMSGMLPSGGVVISSGIDDSVVSGLKQTLATWADPPHGQSDSHEQTVIVDGIQRLQSLISGWVNKINSENIVPAGSSVPLKGVDDSRVRLNTTSRAPELVATDWIRTWLKQLIGAVKYASLRSDVRPFLQALGVLRDEMNRAAHSLRHPTPSHGFLADGTDDDSVSVGYQCPSEATDRTDSHRNPWTGHLDSSSTTVKSANVVAAASQAQSTNGRLRDTPETEQRAASHKVRHKPHDSHEVRPDGGTVDFSPGGSNTKPPMSKPVHKAHEPYVQTAPTRPVRDLPSCGPVATGPTGARTAVWKVVGGRRYRLLVPSSLTIPTTREQLSQPASNSRFAARGVHTTVADKSIDSRPPDAAHASPRVHSRRIDAARVVVAGPSRPTRAHGHRKLYNRIQKKIDDFFAC